MTSPVATSTHPSSLNHFLEIHDEEPSRGGDEARFSEVARLVAKSDDALLLIREMNACAKTLRQDADKLFRLFNKDNHFNVDAANLNHRTLKGETKDALSNLLSNSRNHASIPADIDRLYQLALDLRLEQLDHGCKNALHIVCRELTGEQATLVKDALVAVFDSPEKKQEVLAEASDLLSRCGGGAGLLYKHVLPGLTGSEPQIECVLRNGRVWNLNGESTATPSHTVDTALADGDIEGLTDALRDNVADTTMTAEERSVAIFKMLTPTRLGKSGLRGLLERQATADFPVEHKRWALAGYASLVSEYAPQLNARQRKDLYRYMHDSQRVPRGWIGAANSAGYEQVMKDKPLYQAYKMLKTNLAKGLSVQDFPLGKKLITGIRTDFYSLEGTFKPQPFPGRALYEACCVGDLKPLENALREHAGDRAALFSLLTLADPSGNSALGDMMQVEPGRKDRFSRFVDLIAAYAPGLDATQQKSLSKYLSKSLHGQALFSFAQTAACREVMRDASIRRKYEALNTALAKGALLATGTSREAAEGPAYVSPSNRVESLYEKIFPGYFIEADRTLIKEVDPHGLIEKALSGHDKGFVSDKQGVELHELFRRGDNDELNRQTLKALTTFFAIVDRASPLKPKAWQRSLYYQLHEAQKVASSYRNRDVYTQFKTSHPELHAVYKGIKDALQKGNYSADTLQALIDKDEKAASWFKL